MKEEGFPRPPSFVWKDNRLLPSYWYCWDQLFLQNGLLMKSHKTSAPFPQNTEVIPKGLINVVLRSLHGSSSGGHMGFNRTTARAREGCFGLICAKLFRSLFRIVLNVDKLNRILA